MNDIIGRITDYLASGGLFNPELMDGPATRDLLIDCREEIARLREQLNPAVKFPPEVTRAHEVCKDCGEERWLHNAMLHVFVPYPETTLKWHLPGCAILSGVECDCGFA